jgi:toxin ParE1/3/4
VVRAADCRAEIGGGSGRVIEVEWTRPAQADLAQIDQELAERDPDFADRVGGAAIEAAAFISEWPGAGPRIGARRRKWPVKGTLYILLYRLRRGRLQIVRVQHNRRNWRPL